MKTTHRLVVTIGILNLGLALTAMGAETASLIEQLGSWRKNKAKKASDELAAIGPKVVPELIVEALNSKSRRRRRFAVRALRQIGQDADDAIPALSRVLDDSDTLTREYAVETLGKMVKQADQVIPILVVATKDRDRNVREQARAMIAYLTEARKSQGQEGSAQVQSTANESSGATTHSTGAEGVNRHEPLRPKEPEAKSSKASPDEHPHQHGNYAGKQTLIGLVRCALFVYVIAGFFTLLYVYRDSPC